MLKAAVLHAKSVPAVYTEIVRKQPQVQQGLVYTLCNLFQAPPVSTELTLYPLP